MELSQESRAAERFVRLTAPSASNPTRQRARRRSFPFRTLTASTQTLRPTFQFDPRNPRKEQFYQKVCQYDCMYVDEPSSETVYVKENCPCPKAKDVAENPPFHSSNGPQPPATKKAPLASEKWK